MVIGFSGDSYHVPFEFFDNYADEVMHHSLCTISEEVESKTMNCQCSEDADLDSLFPKLEFSFHTGKTI